MFARALTIAGVFLATAGILITILIVQAGSPTAAVLDALDLTIGRPVSSDNRPIHVVIRPGESASDVAARLERSGVVRSALGFRLAVRLNGLASHLEAGDYELRPDMSLGQIISILAQGRMAGGLLTIPEGWRAFEIADVLAQDQLTSRDDFLREVEHPDINLPAALRGLPVGTSLEGFLFPDSYRITPGTPAARVVQIMVGDFADHLTPDLLDGFQANGLTLYQGVILASIVEREAVVPAERPLIASVYLNRLHRGMRLQADPTVQYALVAPDANGPPPGGYWKTGLTIADLRVRSPYNTYETVGLPPGPICNPGLASLAAVAHPATSDYLYFVARPDHTHAFARTLEEHQKNVAQYQP